MAMRTKSGFTLIELMVVLVIIAVVITLSVPGLLQVSYRNTLTRMTDNVRQATVKARDLAMKTRQAAVVEVRADSVWVNLLSRADCASDLAQRCVSSPDGEVSLVEGLAEEANIEMCGGKARILGSNGDCDASLLLPNSAFAICYSGRGELYLRPNADANMNCDQTVLTPAATGWQRACGGTAPDSNSLPDGSAYDLYDGAMIVLNRYASECSSPLPESVRRAVFLPSSGSPYAKVAP